MVINMEYKEFSAKTVDDCITDACTELGVPSDRLDYEVVNEGSSGFMGIGSKPAVIKARIKEENASVSETEVKKEVKKELKNEAKAEKKEAKAEVKAEKKADDHAPKAKNIPDEVIEGMKKEASEFLTKVFAAMDLKVTSTFDYNKEDNTLNINLDGDTMGVLIGKR
ncbi:MAG TPA: protein jag, partial [Lachnospiraceae bacterium]|nr:protein jag [Lachnospiraceae bacterium]